MINLLPKENKNGPMHIQHFRIKRVLAVVVISLAVFILSFYWGYLYHLISLHEARLDQLQLEMKCYTTPYQKIQNMESSLQQIHDREDLKQTVFSGYLAPLNALNTLIQLKTSSIWFERVQFNGFDGNFTVTGGATNYKTLAAFIGQLEQDKTAFRELKPEQATIHDISSGREYVQFKISGILAKRGEQGVQEH
ncbi:MAG TPA: hypothetical protein DDW50_08105 [Firmicutes bacterium]|jgi:Tfp pilus assembly protein PilN|nr:hypothetical protein [Bacillota bacterium]